ncbi:MAG: hypothetical protein L0H63_07125 [Nitrococcus sp.]|nr:hypothetical protein [Nitrococcus sp.]
MIDTMDALLRAGFERYDLGLRTWIDDTEFSVTSDGIGRVHLMVVMNNGRTLSDIEYAMPSLVDSDDVAFALVAYALRRLNFTNVPVWLERGKKAQHLLPWNKAALAKIDEEKPRQLRLLGACTTDYSVKQLSNGSTSIILHVPERFVRLWLDRLDSLEIDREAFYKL